ncbi:lytic transglycosylase domain-containing protein [Methylobacter sp.]|uniref:lytic transglycosylase domain-containing protein n=1 Tax=Methylobacter sp. TaxID=2051955 RepID=UPI003DA1F0A1
MDLSNFITRTEQQYQLKPGVLQKLIEVESSGNHTAISKRGAIGLTQLMPDTAKELGVDPHDPYQNIEGGARYLKQNLDKFGGDYAQAIAGYNAGPNNKAVTTRNWDMLPSETKKYVNKFADFIISPASADEIPYQSPKQEAITWDDEQPKESVQQASQIVWDDEPKPKKNETSAIEALAQGAANWGTGNFADEIVGGLNAGIGMLLNEDLRKKGWDENYKMARDAYRDRTESAWNEHPVAYGTGAVAGGVLSPINKVAKGAGLVKQGALSGAIYGAGNAKEVEDIPKDALIGTVTGGGLGAVGNGLGKAYQALTPNKQNNIITGKANDVIESMLPSSWRPKIDTSGTTTANRLDVVKDQAKKLTNTEYRSVTENNMKANLQRLFSNPNQAEPQVIVGNTQRAVSDLLNKRSSGLSRLPSAEAKSELSQFAEGLKNTTSFDDSMNLYKDINEKIRSLKTEGKDVAYWNNIKKALEQDIDNYGTFNNRSNVTDAWKETKANYAKLHSFDDLKNLYDKSFNYVDNEARFDPQKFANYAKNWLLKDGKHLPQEDKDRLVQYFKDVSGNKTAVNYARGKTKEVGERAIDILKLLGIGTAGGWIYNKATANN